MTYSICGLSKRFINQIVKCLSLLLIPVATTNILVWCCATRVLGILMCVADIRVMLRLIQRMLWLLLLLMMSLCYHMSSLDILPLRNLLRGVFLMLTEGACINVHVLCMTCCGRPLSHKGWLCWREELARRGLWMHVFLRLVCDLRVVVWGMMLEGVVLKRWSTW